VNPWNGSQIFQSWQVTDKTLKVFRGKLQSVEAQTDLSGPIIAAYECGIILSKQGLHA
jgi:hypothetical protein